jgi:hypothetical protein
MHHPRNQPARPSTATTTRTAPAARRARAASLAVLPVVITSLALAEETIVFTAADLVA